MKWIRSLIFLKICLIFSNLPQAYKKTHQFTNYFEIIFFHGNTQKNVQWWQSIKFNKYYRLLIKVPNQYMISYNASIATCFIFAHLLIKHVSLTEQIIKWKVPHLVKKPFKEHWKIQFVQKQSSFWSKWIDWTNYVLHYSLVKDWI